jgi:hypothetical protein
VQIHADLTIGGNVAAKHFAFVNAHHLQRFI